MASELWRLAGNTKKTGSSFLRWPCAAGNARKPNPGRSVVLRV